MDNVPLHPFSPSLVSLCLVLVDSTDWALRTRRGGAQDAPRTARKEKTAGARDSERAAPRSTARCEGLYLSDHPHSSAGSTPTPCGALGGHSEESWPWLSSCLHPRCPLPCLLRPYLLHNSQDNVQDTRQHLQVRKRPALQILMLVSSTAGCV